MKYELKRSAGFFKVQERHTPEYHNKGRGKRYNPACDDSGPAATFSKPQHPRRSYNKPIISAAKRQNFSLAGPSELVQKRRYNNDDPWTASTTKANQQNESITSTTCQ